MEKSIREHSGDCKHAGCKCEPLNNAFQTISDREAFIYDGDQDEKDHPCKLVSKDEKHQIVILNKTKKAFTFVKFDACLVRDDKKRCDALVYSDNEFYFVEIKDTTKKGKTKARKEAYQQLKSSIERLNSLDFSNRQRYAIIGFARPQQRIIETSSNTQKAIFMDNYGVKLMEGQTIVLY